MKCLGEISFETLKNFYTNENQRNNGATKMTFHNYPEEWIPEMTFEQLKTDKGQFYLTTQISVNGYCLVKECSTEKDSVLRAEFHIILHFFHILDIMLHLYWKI